MNIHRMLIAIDNSASSERTVTDVVRKMPHPSELHIILLHALHALRPVPPELLKHGGAEEPQEEQRLEYAWLRGLFHSHTSDTLLQQDPTFQL